MWEDEGGDLIDSPLFPVPQCYSHLTEWTELEKAALVNVDDGSSPKLDMVWGDTYYQVRNRSNQRSHIASSPGFPKLLITVADLNP